VSIVRPAPGSGRRAGRVCFRPAPLGPDGDEWLALEACLGADHPARLIWRAVARLDPGRLWDCYKGFGSAAYQPLRLLAAVLYETHHGFHSPALWHRHARESLPVRWLLRGDTPSRTCWYNFRDRLDGALLALVQQTVKQAIAEAFTAADRGAVDGTSVEANSTRHHLLNQDRLDRRLEQLRQATDSTPAVAPPPEGAGEAAEPLPGWMAKTPAGRARQLSRYRAAGAQMSQRQRRNQQKRKSKRTAPDKIFVSPGDPEAVVARDKQKVFRPLYNAQVLGDLDSPLILAYDVAAASSDAGQLGGLLSQAKEGLGAAIKVILADSAYAGGQDLADAQAQGATVYAPWQASDYSEEKKPAYHPKERFEWLAEKGCYRCPAGQELTRRTASRQQRSGTDRVELQLYKAEPSACQSCEQRGGCTSAKTARSISRSEHEELIEELRTRMATDEAKALYRLRKQVIERINADIKQHRGLRRLSGRGVKRARIQLGLVVLAHNLVCLEKLRRRGEDVATATSSPAST
jgi:transposase